MTRQWAAVVVNYEAGDQLLGCMESLLADDSTGDAPAVVVVDNGSTDGSVEALERAYPDVAVVRPGVNVGYAAGANRGIAATEAPIVAVCNADIVVDAGTGKAMLARFAAEPDLGAAGPGIANPDGSVYPSARTVPRTRDAVGHGLFGRLWPTNRFTRRYRQLDVDPERARDADWVSGAAVWLRRAALDEIDGWDERYFMYVEDVDLCWRLRRAGWRVAYEPGARVTHLLGQSTALHPYRMIVEHHRSLARFAARRWQGVKKVILVPAVAFLALRALLEMATHALRGRGRPARMGR